MSVEYRAIIIVGIPLQEFPLSALPQEKIEEIVDNFLIDTDSWCGGTEFFGKIIASVDEGNFKEITLFNYSKCIEEFKIEIQSYFPNLDEVTSISPSIYVINQVF